jgi:hypothetical protein
MSERRGFECAHFACAVFEAEVFVESAECAADGGVEVVLDGVVGPSGEESGDLFPSVSEGGMCGEEGCFVVGVPGAFGDVGGEVVVPSG